MFRVRKATALNVHKICRVVGAPGIQRLLPAYIRLTKDDVYRVSLAGRCAYCICLHSAVVWRDMARSWKRPAERRVPAEAMRHFLQTAALGTFGCVAQNCKWPIAGNTGPTAISAFRHEGASTAILRCSRRVLHRFPNNRMTWLTNLSHSGHVP